MSKPVNQGDLTESLTGLAERVRAGTISRQLFNLVFGGIVKARGVPFAEATAALREILGPDADLLSRLK